MKPHPYTDLQRKVTDIILPVKWANISAIELCCQKTALVYLMNCAMHKVKLTHMSELKIQK